MKRTLPRSSFQRIKVAAYPQEKKDIEEKAKATGKSVSSFAREVLLGYEVKSILDHKVILDLLKINGDQGRLGGLLKMWLSNDEKLETYDKNQIEATIKGALEMIRKNQKLLHREIIKLNQKF